MDQYSSMGTSWLILKEIMICVLRLGGCHWLSISNKFIMKKKRRCSHTVTVFVAANTNLTITGRINKEKSLNLIKLIENATVVKMAVTSLNLNNGIMLILELSTQIVEVAAAIGMKIVDINIFMKLMMVHP